nr:hypothetical protein [Blochmannia endosymbiont of Camponotus (Colobopsis) obliquus]
MDNYFVNQCQKLYICGTSPLYDGYEVKNSNFDINDYGLLSSKIYKV